MTFVTPPVSANGRARTQNDFARWQIRYLFTRRTEWWATMDTLSLREKAALCLRIASRLSWNNPGRLQLTDLAERLDRQAKEIELQNHPAQESGMAAAGLVRS